MSKLFNINSPMMQMMSKLFNWIVLNLLVVIFSLPVITIGASTTAMYYCVGKQQRGEDKLLRDFWKGFKTNFWKATGLWLIIVAIGWILGISFWVCLGDNLNSKLNVGITGPGFDAIGIVVCIVIALFIMVASWSFVLMSRFENTIGEHLRNAYICVLTHFLRSLLIAFVNVLPILIILITGMGNIIYLVAIWYAMAGNYIYWLLRKPMKHLEESSMENHPV